jgi:hypothetical protein
MWGRSLLLSPMRRSMIDFLHFSRQVPTAVAERRMKLGPLAAARQACWPRPNWCALFFKAFALVAARNPELRRAYLALPIPRLYEHPESIGMFSVARRIGDEEVVVFGRQRHPETCSVADLTEYMRKCQEEPIERIAPYRHMRRLARFPRFIRRIVWWLGLNLSGYLRAVNFGTFGITSIGSLGAGAAHVLSVTPSTLFYGMFEPDGSLDVRLQLDHRVYDGISAARALVQVERTLLGEIHDEVLGMSKKQAA